MAGIMPVRTLVKNMMATAKARTLALREASCSRGILPGSSFSKSLRNTHAKTMPTSPPPVPKRSDSVSIWRMRRSRPAPNVARTPSSCVRFALRASRRLAAFPHAMSRTKETAPMRRSRIRREDPSNCWRKDLT